MASRRYDQRMSKDFDSAVRPVIFGVVAIILVGVLWQYWYVAVPILAAVVVGVVLLLVRARRVKRDGR